MDFFSLSKRVFYRELIRIRQSFIYPAVMIVLPAIAFAFFALLLSKGVAENLPVAVVDLDKTPTSRTLVRMIDDTPSANVTYCLQDMLQAEELIKQGRIYAVVYIPENFEKDILSNTQTAVASYVSGINITANGLIAKDIQTAVTTYTAGIQLQVLMKTGLSEKEAYAQLMPVSFDRHILFNPWINYGYYLLPSFLPMMLMIFTVILTIYSIGTELKNSTAGQWMETAKGRIMPALAGKLLPYTATMFVMSLLMNTIMYKWLGVPLNGSIGILILAAFVFILAYQSIAILIITILANLCQSLSIGGGYCVLAFSFSGLTFPLMAMSPVLQKLAYIFPFTIYTDIFIDQAMRGAPVYYSWQYLAWMTVYFILPAAVLPRLKKISLDNKYWGKI